MVGPGKLFEPATRTAGFVGSTAIETSLWAPGARETSTSCPRTGRLPERAKRAKKPRPADSPRSPPPNGVSSPVRNSAVAAPKTKPSLLLTKGMLASSPSGRHVVGGVWHAQHEPSCSSTGPEGRDRDATLRGSSKPGTLTLALGPRRSSATAYPTVWPRPAPAHVTSRRQPWRRSPCPERDRAALVVGFHATSCREAKVRKLRKVLPVGPW
jgi:hypothetical protein